MLKCKDKELQKLLSISIHQTMETPNWIITRVWNGWIYAGKYSYTDIGHIPSIVFVPQYTRLKEPKDQTD